MRAPAASRSRHRLLLSQAARHMPQALRQRLLLSQAARHRPQAPRQRLLLSTQRGSCRRRCRLNCKASSSGRLSFAVSTACRRWGREWPIVSAGATGSQSSSCAVSSKSAIAHSCESTSIAFILNTIIFSLIILVQPYFNLQNGFYSYSLSLYERLVSPLVVAGAMLYFCFRALSKRVEHLVIRVREFYCRVRSQFRLLQELLFAFANLRRELSRLCNDPTLNGPVNSNLTAMTAERRY